MTTPRGNDTLNEQVAEFFRAAGLQYLALDYDGKSIRLSRAEPSTVIAPTVGVVVAPEGGERYPAPGDTVAQGQTLFVIRRYRSEIAVRAPAAGTLVAVLVANGAFADYGQALAYLE